MSLQMDLMNAQRADNGMLPTSELEAEQDKAHKLQRQLLASRQEVAWLHGRVCQLQQNKHARDSAAARLAALAFSERAQRQPLRQQHQPHANA